MSAMTMLRPIVQQLFSSPAVQQQLPARCSSMFTRLQHFASHSSRAAMTHPSTLNACHGVQRPLSRATLCAATASPALPWSWAAATCSGPWQQFGMLRMLSASSAQRQPDGKAQQQKDQKVDSLEITEESYKAITDQIPQRPMGVVEGTSYSLIIAAAFAFLAFLLYQFVTTLLLEPLPYQCYTAAFERLKQDPRITVRLGGDVRAWGSSGGSRTTRQHIPHTIYKTEDGTEHVRLQFHMGGSAGVALVSADMFKGPDGGWQYLYLVVDVATGGSQQAQRLFIVNP